MAFAIEDFAAGLGGRNSLLPEIGVDEAGVIAIGDKADFLAIGLLGHWQTQLARKRPHFWLSELAQRELRSRQLLLLEAEQEIGLVLGRVDTLAHLIAAGGLVV